MRQFEQQCQGGIAILFIDFVTLWFSPGTLFLPKKVVRFKTQQSLVIGRQTNQEIGLVELWKSPVHKAKLKRLEPYWENKTSYCLIGA